jgi:hypothetical protein
MTQLPRPRDFTWRCPIYPHNDKAEQYAVNSKCRLVRLHNLLAAKFEARVARLSTNSQQKPAIIFNTFEGDRSTGAATAIQNPTQRNFAAGRAPTHAKKEVGKMWGKIRKTP